MEMVLASMDLWEIVDGSEDAPPSDADPKIIKGYQRRLKKAMSIIGINLVDSQLHHIKRCKGPAEAWKTLCNIHETRSLSNILFIRRKFFTCKMQEGEDLLDHINKVKALADQLACLEVPVRDEDVVMTLLESLPPSYEYLITALETLPMKDLTMEFVTARLMHEVSKRREKDPQGDDAALVSMQGKGGITSTCKETKRCYYCGKPGHIARFCFKAKNNNKEKENANKAKDDDDYAFATKDGDHCKAIWKWIMDSGATNHMTPHRAAFDMYEVIPKRNVIMSDDSIVEAIGMGSILVEVMVKGQTKRVRIKDVLHVPKLHANLLSVSKILSSGCKVQFNMNECIVRAFDGEVIAIALRDGNLYEVTFTKAYRFMCLQSKKKCRDVDFMEDSTSVSTDLEMRPSGRNENPNVMIVDTSSKTPFVDDNVEKDPSNEEATPNPGCSSTPSTPSRDGSTSGEHKGQPWEHRRYALRERRPLGDWWKNHILPKQDVERANVAFVDDPLNLCDAMHSEDASKWEAAMQDGKEHLVCKLKKSYYRLKQSTRSMGLQVLDYLQSGSVEDYDKT
jgi:hypothetical protein